MRLSHHTIVTIHCEPAITLHFGTRRIAPALSPRHRAKSPAPVAWFNLILPGLVFFFGLPDLRAATTSDGFVYSDNGATITITGYTGSGGTITIPSAINATLTHEPVVAIGPDAFGNGIKLAGVTIPTSVTSIGDGAFSGCANLTGVTIPSSVTSIGIAPFQGCSQLGQINVDAANPDFVSAGGVLFNAAQTQLLQYPVGSAHSSYTIPSSVTSVNDFAFAGARNLSGVSLPASITAIGNDAFSGSSVASVSIPSGVTSIGLDAFLDCTGLTQINVDAANPDFASAGGVLFDKTMTQLIAYPAGNTQTSYSIPSGIVTIGTDAFNDATNLASITLPSGVTTIGSSAFASASLTAITLPASVNSIGADALTDCTLLTQINVDPANTAYASSGGVLFNKAQTLLLQYPAGNAQMVYTVPGTVTSIGDFAFLDCRDLLLVNIPYGVASIGQGAFSGSGINVVGIPASITSIGEGAFVGCQQLTQIVVDATNPDFAGSGGVLFNKAMTQLIAYPAGNTQTSYSIPAGVTMLAVGAFSNGSHLTSITIPAGATTIGNNAFVGCTGLTSISIPASITSIGTDAFKGCSALSQFNVDSANPDYSSPDGVLYDKSLTNLIQYPPASTQTSFVIPNNVVYIGSDAFFGCSGLTSITIPATVTAIGAQAFAGCTKLTQINVDSANASFASSGGVLFNKAQTELVAYPAANTQTSYSIPSGVTSIADYAFSSCAFLTSVTIPASVTSIGDNAFNSSSALAKATFQGNAPAFFGGNVFLGTAAGFTIHYPASATGFTSPTWKGYPAVADAPASPSPPPSSPASSSGGGGGGGAPSLWFYGALGLLVLARKFAGARSARFGSRSSRRDRLLPPPSAACDGI